MKLRRLRRQLEADAGELRERGRTDGAQIVGATIRCVRKLTDALRKGKTGRNEPGDPR